MDWFKNPIKSQVAAINDNFVAMGASGLLSVSISGFNSTLYSSVTTVMSSVVMPIAYAILAIFLALELYHICDHSFADQGPTSIPLKLVFRLILRIMLAKALVDNCLLILTMIYDVGLQIIRGISGVTGSGSTGLDLDAINASIDAMGIGEQILMMIECLIVQLVTHLCGVFVKAICIGRFIKIYVYIALSPMPMATLLADEVSDVGKNFLKSFTALCLQGPVIYIILSFYPALLNSDILETGTTNILGMMGYAILLVILIFGSQRVADSICHAS